MRRGRLAAVAGAAAAALVLGAVLLRQDPAPFGARTLAFACAGRICVWEGEREQRVVAHVRGGYASHPLWSPNGARLAFMHTQDRPHDPSIAARRDLYVMNANGSDRVRVAAGLAETIYGLPMAWSPDSTSLAVSLNAPESRARPSAERVLLRPPGNLYVVDVAGRSRRRLTQTRLFDGYPAWVGPRRVAYARVRPRGEFPLEPSYPYEIRVVDSVSGSDRLVLRRRGEVVDLVASPDGRRAVVLEDGVRAFLLSLRSGRQTTLGRGPPMLSAAWSPDGRLLALNGGAIVDPATKRVRSDASPYDCADPDWSPDGRWIVCTVGYGEEDEKRRGGSDLTLVRVATGARVQLTDCATARDARWRPRAKAARTP
jgi:Tol biopolymer transport system component